MTEFASHKGRTWSLQNFFEVDQKMMKMRIIYTSDTDSLRFWPIYHWRSTDIPPTINGQLIGQLLAAISTEISADSRSTCRPSLGRHLGWCICQYVDQHILVVISAESWSICWPTYRSTISRYMSTDTSVECQSICRPIYQSRGAQNTHDPKRDITGSAQTLY